VRLREVRLREVRLREVRLREVRLREVRLREVRLREVRLRLLTIDGLSQATASMFIKDESRGCNCHTHQVLAGFWIAPRPCV